MEAEILKFLPWASVLAMIGVVGALARWAMTYRTDDEVDALSARVRRNELSRWVRDDRG